MGRRMGIIGACLALALTGIPVAAQQGQGQGKGQAKTQAQEKPGKGRGQERARAQEKGKAGQRANPGQGRGNAAARGNPGNRGEARSAGGRGRGAVRGEARRAVDRLAQPFRTLQGSRRAGDRFVLGAAAFGTVRGLDAGAIDLRRSGERLEVRNRRGELLLDLDDDRARDLGRWDLRLLGDRDPQENAPAFCRSGAGHPVWGREWCLDKGFGLGRSNDRLWSRTTDVGDIIWRPRTDRDRLDRGSIIDVLGDVVFGRLALHALSLGFDAPLAGRWVAEPDAPRLLLIDAGNEPVAELVDLDRDDRVDVLYVTHYGW